LQWRLSYYCKEEMRPSAQIFKDLNIFSPKIVEIGVNVGDHSKELLENFKDALIFHVDNEEYKEVWEKFNSYPGRSVYIIKDSRLASQKFSDESLDFIYIDGDHTVEGCMIDLVAWYPKLKVGGVFGGHDYFNATCEVKRAVDFFSNNVNITVNTYELKEGEIRSVLNSDWWFIK